MKNLTPKQMQEWMHRAHRCRARLARFGLDVDVATEWSGGTPKRMQVDMGPLVQIALMELLITDIEMNLMADEAEDDEDAETVVQQFGLPAEA